MKKIILRLTAISLLTAKCLLPVVSFAQPGSIDLSINSSGRSNLADGANGSVNTSSIQSDGKIIIGGAFSSYSGTASNRIARLNVDGTLDSTFIVGTGADGSVNTTSIQSDGKIIIGGGFTTYNGTVRRGIARLNADGTLDSTFNIGTGADGFVYTSSIQSDGKIIIGGGFSTYNGTVRNNIARLNADGTADSTFNIGTGASGMILTSSIQSDGKIIIGGSFTTYNGTVRNNIARLNADGTLDNTFTGTGTYNVVNTSAIQSDGKIIIGGYFTSYNGTARKYIARLNTDGTLDSTFNIGAGANSIVNTISIQSDGKIIIGGSFTTYDGTTSNRIARLNVDGTLDSTFIVGTGANGTVSTSSIQSDGKIIIGGDFNLYSETVRNGIARLNTDGTPDSNFIVGMGANGSVRTSSIQSDGKIIIGGDFNLYNGIASNHIARLNADGALDSTFVVGTGANGNVSTSSIQSDGKIIIGGNFTAYDGTAKNYIARLNTDGTLDGTFNMGTGANAGVSTIAIQSDGKIIIGGDFTTYNGTTSKHIARLNADGTLDNTFNIGTGANYSVYTSSIQSDGKIIIGGNFFFYNGIVSNFIARLNADGTLDNTFNIGTGANSYVYTSSIQSDGKIIIGGGFKRYNGTGRSYIARLNVDGTLDSTFNIGMGANSAVYTSSIQSDGKIIIGGGFTTYNGTVRNRIARLLNSSPVIRSLSSSTICPGDSIFLQGSFRITSGTYIDTLVSYQGRDSIVTTNLTVLPANTFSQTITKCAGQSLTVGKNTYTKSGTYTDVLTSSKGCDSTITTNLTVLPANTSSQTITKCAGQSLTVGKNTYNKSGTYTDVLISYKGCDSTVTTNLTILPANTFSQTITKCAGQSVTVGKSTYTQSGTYTDVLASYQGCDSTVTTNLSVLPVNTFSQTITKCAGQSVTVGKNTYSQSGTYTDVLTSYNGCDSTVTTNLTVLAANTFSQTITKCAGQSVTVGKSTYTQSGTYTDVLASYQGCDSTVTTNLTVLPVNTFSQTITKCAGQSLIVGKNTYTKSGTYTDVLISYKGCDSSVTTNLTVLPTNTFTQTKTICIGEFLTVGMHTYSSSGTYIDTLVSSQNCDSIVTTSITMGSSSACSLVWPGDANHDGVANNFDLLAIGVAYGKTGSVRSNASLNWVGQAAADWADTLSNGTNYKHADCDGNGTINAVDTTAILINYGFTHSKTFAGATPTPSDPALFLKTSNDTVSSNTAVSVQVELGTNTGTANNAYGIAFTINYDPTLIDSSSLSFDVVNSWLGTKNTNLMVLDYINFSNGNIDLAITRNDHNNSNGFGTIGELSFITSNNFTGNKALNLSVSNVKMISNNETDLPVNLGKNAVIVTGIKAIQQKTISVKIQPNPFSSSATISIEGLNSNEPLSFELYDIVGKKVKQIEGISTRQFTVSKENIQSGIYFYKVSSSKAFVSAGRVVIE